MRSPDAATAAVVAAAPAAPAASGVGTSLIAQFSAVEEVSTKAVAGSSCPAAHPSSRPVEGGLGAGGHCGSLGRVGSVAATEGDRSCGGRGWSVLARFAAGAASTVPRGTSEGGACTAAIAGVDEGSTCVAGTADVADAFGEVAAPVSTQGSPATALFRR